MENQPAPFSQQDLQPQADNDKIIAALAYIFAPILSIIILVTDMKNKPFLKYHAYQSLIFGLALVVVYVILTFTFVGLCLAPLLFVAQLYYGYLAYSRGIFTIPVVTDLAKNFFKDFPSPSSSV